LITQLLMIKTKNGNWLSQSGKGAQVAKLLEERKKQLTTEI